MWKTTDRYVQQKRVKAVEAELKLKQVYIPQYSTATNAKGASIKGGANIYNGNTNGGADYSNNGKPCESCSSMKSSQWYPWSGGHSSSRLCQNCWDYWKKYGGLKNSSKYDVEDTKKKTSAVTAEIIIDDDKVSDLSNRQMHK